MSFDSYLSNQETLFEHAFHYAAIGMALVNLQGHVIKVNRSLCQLLGLEEHEILNKSFKSITYDDDVAENVLLFNQLIRNEISTYRMEKRYIHKNGSIIWGLLSVSLVRKADGSPLYLVSQVQDITAKKKATELLRQSAERYKEIVEHSPDGVVITKDGVCLYANETLVKMIGASSVSELIGRSAYDFIPAKDREGIQKIMEKGDLRMPSGVIRGKLLCLNGQKIDIEVKAIPTFFENQIARHLIIRDISDKIRYEELLLNSEKLTVAGQLAAGIVHEVRNPLTAIKGFLQLIRNQINNIPYLDVVFSEISRIELILTELLIVAKPQVTQFKMEHLNPLLQNVVTLLKGQATIKNINLKLIITNPSIYLYCDPNQIKQVIINCLKNAIEAMSEGGNIYLKTISTDTHLSIEIIDEGPGIPKEHLARIGEPFYTTKESGTGLGVMVCKKIIENHQGKLEIKSSKQGTTVRFTLPLTQMDEY